LDIKKTKHQRLISLSNSTSQDVDCEKLIAGISHFTTKKEKSLHGYGVRNIRRTIEKYGGMMELSCENGTFTMSMILNLDSQTAAE
ncbi:MAG: GHKL domain-containing protein, partial [Ruminococcus sp.]|nr:GHKL domain-containing protein [Ruminococcus sp.]